MNEQQYPTKDTRPSGASIRQRVFGEANGQPTAQRDPVLEPFFQTALDHVWGGVWNRPVKAPFLLTERNATCVR